VLSDTVTLSLSLYPGSLATGQPEALVLGAWRPWTVRFRASRPVENKARQPATHLRLLFNPSGAGSSSLKIPIASKQYNLDASDKGPRADSMAPLSCRVNAAIVQKRAVPLNAPLSSLEPCFDGAEQHASHAPRVSQDGSLDIVSNSHTSLMVFGVAFNLLMFYLLKEGIR
jgi:hypothetical protein